MKKPRIIYEDFWRNGTIIDNCSQHPQFPVEDTQVDTRLQFWRTRYGTNSGNGLFVVIDSNKYIDFDEGGSELTGTLVTGSYNGNTLAIAIKTAMNAAPGKTLTYNCVYSESAAKFTISAGSNFTIHWATGTHKASDISDLSGFSDAADDTGSASYTSDYRRIHYPKAYASNDLGSEKEINFVAILGHSITASGTIKLVTASDEDFTEDLTSTDITNNLYNVFFFLSSSVTNCYARIDIYDPANPQSFIQVGHIILGYFWELEKGVGKNYDDGKESFSSVDFSDSMVSYAQEKPTLGKKTLPIKGVSTSTKEAVLLFHEEVDIVKAFVICLDYETPNTDSYWVQNVELVSPQYQNYDNWDWALVIREVL